MFDHLNAYRRYMRGRGYAKGTLWARWAVAREWCARFADPNAATYRDVEAWIIERDLTPGSTRNLLVNLRAFYRWMMREELVGRDPTLLVDRPLVPARLPRPAPDRDVARLANSGDLQLRALVAVMACAGLRCVECSRLDWRDVDVVEATVIVDGKGRRERLIDLSIDVVRALAALRLASTSKGAVFVGPSGRRMSPARVSQRVNRALRATGSTTQAHQFRHRCATDALRVEGAELLDVRNLLGHASVATTEIYTAAVPGRTAKISRALNLPAA